MQFDRVSHSVPMMAEWNIKAVNIHTGEVTYEETQKNLIVDTGRADILNLLFGFSGVTLVAMGAGASGTTAAYTDTKLYYEYPTTASGTRYALFNQNGIALSGSDVQQNTFVDTTESPNITYRYVIAIQATIPANDPNNGNPYQEYGLFSVNTLPATPSSTSGTMFNRLVANTAIIKDNSTQIIVNITLRV